MDVQLYYRERGRGETLILLHGNGEDGSYFSHQIEFFSHRYRVIAVDTRGHGNSPRGTAPFTMEQFAEDVASFMEEHGIADATVLGFSDGANIAMKLALQHPKKVNALILNGGNLHPKGVKRTVQIPIEIGYRIAKIFAKRSAEAKKNEEMLGLMVKEPMIDPKELGAIKVPVLVLCGTRDMIKRSHSETIAKSVEGARLSFIKGNHFIANQEPTAFNVAVDRFLESIPRTGRASLE